MSITFPHKRRDTAHIHELNLQRTFLNLMSGSSSHTPASVEKADDYLAEMEVYIDYYYYPHSPLPRAFVVFVAYQSSKDLKNLPE